MKIKIILTCLFAAVIIYNAAAQGTDGNSIAWYIAHAPFKISAVTEPVFNQKTFNVKDYGAVGDGQTLNTGAIEKAIAACNSAGGGTVLIPPGLWLTGPIELKSNVNLHADRGSLITFSTDHTQYPMIDGGMYWPKKEGMAGEDYLKTLKGKTGLTPADYLPACDFLRPVLVSITVLVNCKFVGDNNFKLGRYHLDSQFYLINCTFASNMADAPIYQAASSKGVKWGQRTCFFNCHKENGDYAWFKNNLDTAPGSPAAKKIDVLWAMDNKWNPIK
jgi:hypothetical protein